MTHWANTRKKRFQKLMKQRKEQSSMKLIVKLGSF